MAIELNHSTRPADYSDFIEIVKSTLRGYITCYNQLHFKCNEHVRGDKYYIPTQGIGVNRIEYMSANSARQLLADTLDSLYIPSKYVQYIPSNTCTELLLLAVGKQYYWRDKLNSSTSLESWSNHFIGKVVSYRNNRHGYYFKGLMHSYELIPSAKYSIRALVSNFDYDTSDLDPETGWIKEGIKPTAYPVGPLFNVTLEAPRYVRQRIRMVDTASKQGTLKINSDGFIQVPIELWAKDQLKRYQWRISEYGSLDESIHPILYKVEGWGPNIKDHSIYQHLVVVDSYTVDKDLTFNGHCKYCKKPYSINIIGPRYTYI